jgi:hypothetical protein
MNNKKAMIVSLLWVVLFILVFSCTSTLENKKIETSPVPDTTPPQFMISFPTNGQVVYTNLSLFGFASDDRAIEGVYISLDSNTFQMVSITGLTNWVTNLALSNGSHIIEVYAKDQAGNVSSTVQLSLIADSSLPSISFTSPNNNELVNSNFTISGEAHSNGSTPVESVYLSIDGGNYGLVNGTENWNTNVTLSGGFHTIRAYAVNTNSFAGSPSQIIVRIDTAAPSNSITSPLQDASFTNRAFTVTGTASDDIEVSNVYLSVDAGAFGVVSNTANWSTNLNLSSGIHTIQAFAKDLTGKVSATNTISFLSGAIWFDNFDNNTVGTLPAIWWSSTNSSPGGYFYAWVTNTYQAPGRTNGNAFYINGRVTDYSYWIGTLGTSVDSLIPGGTGSYLPVDLTPYSKIRFYVHYLTQDASTVLSVKFVDNQRTNILNDNSAVVATWSTHNYTNIWSFPGDRWFEVNLEYTNTNQSVFLGTTNMFCRDMYNGRQDGTQFDWQNVVAFKFDLSAVGGSHYGNGGGEVYIIDEMMLIPR